MPTILKNLPLYDKMDGEKQWSCLTKMETIVQQLRMQLSQGRDDSGSKVKKTKTATMIIMTW